MKKGVLLINVGTPEDLTLNAVKKYLDEFLTDPCVIALPSLFRNILVKGFIVPFRSPQSLKKYEKIWTAEGSPLRFHSENLKNKISEQLGDNYVVISSMRYGVPSIDNAIKKFVELGVQEVFVLPMYPQWSESTTESSLNKVKELNEVWKLQLKFLEPFYNDQGFLNAQKALIEESYQKFNPDFVLFSFHGLPDKPVAQRYYQECLKTAELLSEFVKPTQWKVSFQSRLGPTKWLEPSTQNTLLEIANKGFKRLMVVSPAFVADGLETLEELAMEGAHEFKNASGGEFHLVPSLNSSPKWVEAIVGWVRAQ